MVKVSPLMLKVPSVTVNPASAAKFVPSVLTAFPVESVILNTFDEGFVVSVWIEALKPSASSLSIRTPTVSPSATSICTPPTKYAPLFMPISSSFVSIVISPETFKSPTAFVIATELPVLAEIVNTPVVLSIFAV